MRKVILGAIQPGSPPPDARLYCLREGFSGDIDEIMKGHVLPRLDNTLALLGRCAENRCDMVTTSEDICGVSHYLLGEPALFDGLVERSAKIVQERISALAKQSGMYIMACFFRREGGKNYNVAAIFDRRGDEVFAYRKTHLPPDEKWQVEAGNDIQAVELDFGTVGAAICYDMMFPEMLSVLSFRGAEVVFHPTAGYGWYDSIGEATLRTRANDNSVYLVTAKNYIYNGAGHSSVIDPWGLIRADAGFYENEIVCQEVDLDAKKAQPEWFYPTNMSGIAELSTRMRMERRPDLYGPLAEPTECYPIPDDARRAELRRRVKDGRCRWG